MGDRTTFSLGLNCLSAEQNTVIPMNWLANKRDRPYVSQGLILWDYCAAKSRILLYGRTNCFMAQANPCFTAVAKDVPPFHTAKPLLQAGSSHVPVACIEALMLISWRGGSQVVDGRWRGGRGVLRLGVGVCAGATPSVSYLRPNLNLPSQVHSYLCQQNCRPLTSLEACSQAREQTFSYLEQTSGTATSQDAAHTPVVRQHWWGLNRFGLPVRLGWFHFKDFPPVVINWGLDLASLHLQDPLEKTLFISALSMTGCTTF